MSTSDVVTPDAVRVATTPGRASAARRPLVRKDSWAFWLFVGPFAAGLILFTYAPILWSLTLSFFEARMTVTPSTFVGLDNYVSMLGAGAFRDSLVTFSIYALLIVPLTMALALGLALLVHRLRFARAFFRSVFFIPTACSYVVACVVWRMSIFNGVRFGLANVILNQLGFDNIAWLATYNPPLYWIPLVTVRLWLQLGFFMILFLAGLQRIPQHLYEAAWMDGATPGWQTFRNVTLPQLRPTSIAVLLLCVVNAYQAFDEFYNFAVPVIKTPLQALFATAMTDQDYGRGSAGAMLLALIIMIVTLVQGKLFGFGRSDD